MRAHRLRRSLTALRKRICRSMRGHAALPGRYDRWLLFGGGAMLTLATLAAAAIGIAHRFERCLDDWRTEFLVQRDFVNASVERNQARLLHLVETYEALSHVHERDAVPADRYGRLLKERGGIVETEEDIGAAPFTIVSTLTEPADRARLAKLLRLVREISPSSLLRLHDAAYDIGGFLYTEDRRFLAAWPLLRPEALADVRSAGVAPLIARHVEHVDAELRKHTDATLRRERVFWVALYESGMYGTLVKHYAAPVYRGKKRIAVLVVTVPATQIPRLFQPALHDPDFFMVSRDRQHLLGLDKSNPRKQHWARALSANPSVLDLADERVRFVRRGGDFFLMQRIAGPEWIAVAAFDWRTIAANLKVPVLSTISLAALVLIVQWAFVVAIDRLVLAPLRVRARRVFESEAFSRTVLSTAPVGLTVYDPSAQRIVMQNDIARVLLAASPDETGFYRRLLAQRGPRRRGVRRGTRHRDSAAADRVRTVEVSVTAADGRRRVLSVALARARYREQQVVLCSLTDVSRQKETVRLLRRARQSADEASSAKSMLVATISHEIRTPLYGALGNLELLSIEPLAPAHAARLASVRQAFDALLALVDDVLDLSKAEAHELRLNIEPFEPAEVLERCAQTLATAITAKGLRFSCLIDPAVRGTWQGDRHRMMQIVTNLLANACKFTERGAVTLSASVARAMEGEASETIVVAVADSGIGIAANRQARIFEPFVQADGSIGRRFGGTGLGLSLCRRLVELMGGRIEVQSIEGCGTVFTAHLPLRREPSALAPCVPLDPFFFDEIVVACEDLPWQATLATQLRHRFGSAVTIRSAHFGTYLAPACARSVLLLGSHDDALPLAWRNAHAEYADVLVMSARGPLHPQRRADALHVTALSAATFELALGACARNGETSACAPVAAHTFLTQEPHRTARVLVVEDDPVSRTLLAHQLTALGYRDIDLACDGRQALAECGRRPYDLVLADLCMPTMGGRELLAALRAQGMAMPVIAHTAAPCDSERARQDGFERLLHKPLTLAALRAALDAVLHCPPSASDAPPAPAQLLRAVFVQAWRDDERRLCDAVRDADTDLFLQTLHRIKGALLALGAREAANRCDALRAHVSSQGMANIADRCLAFRQYVEGMSESASHIQP